MRSCDPRRHWSIPESCRQGPGDYHQTSATLVEVFGRETAVEELEGRDFERLRAVLTKTRKAVALGNEIQRVRSVFAFAFKDRLITSPVNFGASFTISLRMTNANGNLPVRR
jgi:hypothetical protein